MTEVARPSSILCIGEVLWDVLPSGTFLGGAPFNVACDLHQLGLDVTMVSRVGRDDLGARVIDEMRERSMRLESMQTDATLPTGVVHVDFDVHGHPRFSIEQPSAWDAIELPALSKPAESSFPSVLVYGSLAQRSTRTRSSIHALWKRCPIRIFDVNLRAPFDDQDLVRASLHAATILKLNRDEADRLARWFDLPMPDAEFSAAVYDRFGCETICITKDRDGAVVWHDELLERHPGFRVTAKDSVGAGDAFLAGFICRMLEGAGWKETLEFANLLGAFVASSNGATPRFTREDLAAFRRACTTTS